MMDQKKLFKYGCISIIITLLMIITGCFAIYHATSYMVHYYDYIQVEEDYIWGDVGVRLLGSYKDESPGITIFGSPYEVFIYVHVKERDDGVVTINGVLLKDQDGNVVWENSEEQSEPIEHYGDGTKFDKYTSFAPFTYTDIPLEYQEYKLIVDFKIETEWLKVEEEVELELKKNYYEKKRNYFLNDIT
jgi:hypothetical protein